MRKGGFAKLEQNSAPYFPRMGKKERKSDQIGVESRARGSINDKENWQQNEAEEESPKGIAIALQKEKF